MMRSQVRKATFGSVAFLVSCLLPDPETAGRAMLVVVGSTECPALEGPDCHIDAVDADGAELRASAAGDVSLAITDASRTLSAREQYFGTRANEASLTFATIALERGQLTRVHLAEATFTTPNWFPRATQSSDAFVVTNRDHPNAAASIKVLESTDGPFASMKLLPGLHELVLTLRIQGASEHSTVGFSQPWARAFSTGETAQLPLLDLLPTAQVAVERPAMQKFECGPVSLHVFLTRDVDTVDGVHFTHALADGASRIPLLIPDPDIDSDGNRPSTYYKAADTRHVSTYVALQNGSLSDTMNGVDLPLVDIGALAQGVDIPFRTGRIELDDHDIATPEGTIAAPKQVWFTRNGRAYAPGRGCGTGERVDVGSTMAEKLQLPLGIALPAGTYEVHVEHEVEGQRKIATFVVTI